MEDIYGEPVILLMECMEIIYPITYRLERVPLPLQVAEHNHQIHLYSYFLFCNGILFFHTMSLKLNFRTVQYCKIRSADNITSGWVSVINTRTKRGFEVIYIHAENKLNINYLYERLLPTKLEIYGSE